MDTLIAFADALLARLAWTSAQAVVLIAAVWLVLRCMPRLSPSIRCALWWLVAAQLLLGLAIGTPVQLHWLRPIAQAPLMAHEMAAHKGALHVDTGANASIPMPHAAAFAPATAARTWSWSEVALLPWLAVIVLQGAVAARHWRESRAWLREARTTAPSSLQIQCMHQARALGLRRAPVLRMSPAIASPQVTGLVRPVLLLPAGQRLSAEEWSMAIAHELAHIRRGDLWLGWLPAMAQRLFFFHPLVRWAMREYAVHREAACDAQVLQRQGAPAHRYGHLLVRLGVADPLHASLAGASSTFLHLKRRLIMLQQSDTTPRLRSWLLVAAVALTGVLPYRITARAQDAPRTVAGTAAAVMPEAPDTPPAPAAPAMPPAPPVPPVPDMPAPPPAPPMPPAPPAPIGHGTLTARYMALSTHDNASRGFFVYDGDVLLFDGDEHDKANLDHLAKPGSPMLWFRRDGHTYVSHDSDLIRRARDAYAPVHELANARSNEWAARQSEWAAQQSTLAAREGALAEREARLASQRASLDAQRLALQGASSQARYAGEQSLQGQAAGLDAIQAEITREHEALRRTSDALARQAAVLSARQASMSAQQAAASRQANRSLDSVLDEAVAHGLAKPADR
jgi:beta-lactamase regulating signal transducer with metallopeptidase domain